MAEIAEKVLSAMSLPSSSSLPVYPEKFTVSKTEKGRYKVVYDGIELPYSLTSERNVHNIIIMTQQALAQYDSCKAQHGLLGAIRRNLADCTFSTKEAYLSGMNISINDSLLWTTNIIDESQFTKALTRLIGKHGKEVTNVTSEGELYYFGNGFVSFVNNITRGNKEQSYTAKN